MKEVLSLEFLLNLKGNFLKDTIPKPNQKLFKKFKQSTKNRIKEDNDIFIDLLNLSLRDESIYIQAANLNETEVDVAIASSRFYSIH